MRQMYSLPQWKCIYANSLHYCVDELPGMAAKRSAQSKSKQRLLCTATNIRVGILWSVLPTNPHVKMCILLSVSVRKCLRANARWFVGFFSYCALQRRTVISYATALRPLTARILRITQALPVIHINIFIHIYLSWVPFLGKHSRRNGERQQQHVTKILSLLLLCTFAWWSVHHVAYKVMHCHLE